MVKYNYTVGEQHRLEMSASTYKWVFQLTQAVQIRVFKGQMVVGNPACGGLT